MAENGPSTPNQPIQRDEKETTTYVESMDSNAKFDDVSPVIVERPKPLNERIPKTSDVLKTVAADFGVCTMIKHFGLSETDVKGLLCEVMWESVALKMVDLLNRFSAKNTRAVKKMQKNYTKAIHDLQDGYIFYLHPKEEHRIYMQSIGFKFIESFHRHLRSLREGEVSVNEQIQLQASALVDADTNLIFEDKKVAENTYYVVGFLGFQLSNAAERRKAGSPVRACVEFICSNSFISPTSDVNRERVERIRLNGCPTGLVDRRISLSRLQYADEQCWKVFDTVEKVYNSLVRLDNFIISGGTLLSEVCFGILQNQVMMDLFKSLLDKDNQFGDGAISEAFQMFLNVFAHVRARDVAAKMNAVDYTESTVSTRPSLAGLSKAKSKTGGKAKTAVESTSTTVHTTEEVEEHNEILLDLDNYDAEEESDLDAFKICSHSDETNNES